ncbi:MAG: hypothetical protein R6U59_02400 [Eubacteriales bacterium]
MNKEKNISFRDYITMIIYLVCVITLLFLITTELVSYIGILDEKEEMCLSLIKAREEGLSHFDDNINGLAIFNRSLNQEELNLIFVIRELDVIHRNHCKEIRGYNHE